MRLENENTDAAVLVELGLRLSRARLARNLTQEDLALAAGLSKSTVERLETGRSVQLTNFIRALRALQLVQNLDQLVPASSPSPIDQLKRHKRERHRATSPREPARGRGAWTWASGDNP